MAFKNDKFESYVYVCVGDGDRVREGERGERDSGSDREVGWG